MSGRTVTTYGGNTLLRDLNMGNVGIENYSECLQYLEIGTGLCDIVPVYRRGILSDDDGVYGNYIVGAIRNTKGPRGEGGGRGLAIQCTSNGHILEVITY